MKPDSQYTWDLTPLQSNDDDKSAPKKRNQIKGKVEAFIKNWQKRDDYLKNPSVLRTALDQYEEIKHTWWPDGDEAFYFYLRGEQNQSDPKIKAKKNNIDEFALDLMNRLDFFHLNIGKIKNNERTKFLKSKNLKPYKHYLERIFAKSAHFLSEKEEKILSLKNNVAYENWVQMTAKLLTSEEKSVVMADGKEKTVSFSEILSLTSSTDKSVRDCAVQEFNEVLKKYSDVAEIELNSVLANKKINDQLRGFELPESSRLLSDDIEKKIVDQMAKVVSDNYDISQKIYQFKAQLFGYEKLEYHERNLDYGEISKEISFDKACQIIDRVTKNIDPEFNQIYQGFIKNNLIDASPKTGKRSGAFCTFNLLSQPTYILLNYTNRIDDVLIFAHELGHGINDELMRKEQNALNFGNSLAMAEVASTFMEDFILDEILKEADDELRLGALVQRLDRAVSSVFRQVACYLFEQELHKTFREKNYLSKEEIGSLFLEFMKKYMGDYVKQSPGSENWWIYWNHIRVYFYNYSYANGHIISKALQNMVRKDPKSIDRVKRIFSTGLSKSPYQTFLDEGIDISLPSFWQDGVNASKQILDEAMALAKKLGKII